MIELTDIAYVRTGAADLTGAVDFATRIVGLELVDGGEPGVAHLRADARHHCLALVEGESGVIATGFTVADQDALALAETELGQRGITVTRGDAAECRSRRVREFIGLDDPFGNRIELVAGQQTLGRPVAFSRRAGITEFGHVCLDAPDVRDAYRFWSTTFNAKVSDWIGDGACLMRIDPVHHKLAVFQAIGEAIGGFWSMIGGLRHERRNLWFVDDGRTAVLEALLHYTTKGGAGVDLPCVSILDRAEDGRVSSLRVHIDLAPLFERIGAEAAPQDVAS